MFRSARIEVSTYQLVNILLAGFIVLIFSYSALFSPEKLNYPFLSSHTLLFGEASASTGLSRGLSAFVRLRFADARNYNPYSLQMAVFFIIQLFLRLFFTINYRTLILPLGLERSVFLDGIASGVMVLLFFEPFWREIHLF